MADPSQNQKDSTPAFSKRRALFLGRDSDSIIKTFFGSNAMVAILVLALITIFLFKEGAGFIGLYHKSLEEYRESGLEYVDILKESRDDYTELNRYLNDIKTEWINDLKADGLPQAEISQAVFSPEAKTLFMGYMRAGSKLRGFVKQKMDIAIEIRDQNTTNQNLTDTLRNYSTRISNINDATHNLDDEDAAKFSLLLRESGQTELAELQQDGATLSQEDRTRYLELLEAEYQTLAKSIIPVDYEVAVAEVTGDQDKYAEILTELDLTIEKLLVSADAVDFNSASLNKRIETFRELNVLYISQLPTHLNKLASWNPHQPISNWRALGAFLSGKNWITASDQQDWYGLLPLLTGSLLISSIALFFAVPFGVGAAIYVNQIAGPAERNFIKPYIEFISAIPSVVIGFFGVVVFGEAIRLLSQMDALSWVPFFPVQERLNAFTAGCLLALMAIPTIFTLAEDAINNVPRHFKEASYAMGATRLQTTMRVIVPTALSGIISAIMLGFGRVIGETMVVLLCAGNRIKIPDFTAGPGVFFEPVHTMTGIIAQEMGEVVHGSLHYRALFMVGIVLFFASLLINYGAQWVVKKYSKVES
ncbi:MAG: phosphate transport system permease protein [Lentimonas sp.]|jgi:phosphate transport system permease protein